MHVPVHRQQLIKIKKLTNPVIGAFGLFRFPNSFFRFLPFGQPPFRFCCKMKENIYVTTQLSKHDY